MQIDRERMINAAALVVAGLAAGGTLRLHDVPAALADVVHAMTNLGTVPEPGLAPAVSIEASVTPEFLISLEDGRRYKMLKRHLAGLGMTPGQYRTKWGLPADYPMTAPAYAEQRSALAKASGLGTKKAA